VVRDLAVFTRTEGEDTAAAPVDLTTPLETAIRLTANTIRHRARLTRLVRRVPAVMGSVARLTQVFVNLLLNAAQAIPEGSAARHEVHVSLDRVDATRVQVAISDTGEGMSPDIIARVFDPFFTTRPVGEGTGLGLSVCHGIVSSMGGEIYVESEPGRGTIFRVVLPVVGSISRPSTMTPVVDVSCYERRRVAVIDDDPMVCRGLTRLIRDQHDVVPFTSPVEALEAILGGAEPFDAILCDVMMPEMSGIEVYQQIAERDPDLASRLVFVTGGAFSAEARGFLEAGQHRVIEKPATQATLLRAIARVSSSPAVSG
jgi:CheY-like chemotaxis protein/two-component sensor histidine kinase